MPPKPSNDAALQETLNRWVEVSGFAARVLSVVLSEIAEVTSMQAKMAAEVSSHIKNLHGALDSQDSRAHMDAVVLATQAEDHIRQRQEHIMAALQVITEALEEMKAEAHEAHGEAHGEAAGDGQLTDRLSRRLLDGQVLRTVRDKFAQALNENEAAPSKEDEDNVKPPGEVDLF